ncbi:hypothetical protein C8Q79DRAFT_912040 [Trametes meyenii]|nr:hypothetical protein C8Q79DRAFT_912040 [Trametes meyenii]
MSSPTTPLASFNRLTFSQPWRPWSQPIDPVLLRRSVCGLLNRVAGSTLDRTAGRFAELIVRGERGGDSASMEVCSRLVVQRCVADSLRLNLFARMAQKAVDEAEGDDLRWRSVDPYYLGNPAASFQSALRTVLVDELQHALTSEQEEKVWSLSATAGELLVLGVLGCEDVHDIVNTLFSETAKDSDLHCVALCRMLRRIVSSTEASQIVDGLTLVEHIEGILEEDTISLKVRYMMMDMLDQCLYPRPRDVFSSDLQRSEVYGLREDPDHQDDTVELTTALARPEAPVSDQCSKEAQALLTSRDNSKAEEFCRSLRPKSRHRFVHSLMHGVLTAGDETDANLVASFLSQPSTRTLLRINGCLARAFEPLVTALEDAVLDNPSAYHLMAIMLSAAGISQLEMDDLASRIIVKENPARDRLLEEVAALHVAPVDDTFGLSTVVEDSSEDEGTPSDYAYAY